MADSKVDPGLWVRDEGVYYPQGWDNLGHWCSAMDGTCLLTLPYLTRARVCGVLDIKVRSGTRQCNYNSERAFEPVFPLSWLTGISHRKPIPIWDKNLWFWWQWTCLSRWMSSRRARKPWESGSHRVKHKSRQIWRWGRPFPSQQPPHRDCIMWYWLVLSINCSSESESAL